MYIARYSCRGSCGSAYIATLAIDIYYTYKKCSIYALAAYWQNKLSLYIV